MPSSQHQTVVQALRARPQPDPDRAIEALRADMEHLAGTSPLPEGVQFEAATIAGVPCEWATPARRSADAVLLYLHGGGYSLGSIRTHRAMVGRIAAAAELRGVSVEYRRAPEHPFPAAVEDAVAVYRALLEQGTPPARIALAGDSAGGGLAMATLLSLRDQRVPLPCAAVLLSPWVDLSLSGDSITSRAAEDPIIVRDPLQRMADAYLGGADPRTPLASPLYADLAGLPPLLIQVGTAELLLDDATRLASRAEAAGVAAEIEVHPDLIHVFQFFAPLVPEASDAIVRIGDYLRKHI